MGAFAVCLNCNHAENTLLEDKLCPKCGGRMIWEDTETDEEETEWDEEEDSEEED